MSTGYPVGYYQCQLVTQSVIINVNWLPVDNLLSMSTGYPVGYYQCQLFTQSVIIVSCYKSQLVTQSVIINVNWLPSRLLSMSTGYPVVIIRKVKGVFLGENEKN